MRGQLLPVALSIWAIAEKAFATSCRKITVRCTAIHPAEADLDLLYPPPPGCLKMILLLLAHQLCSDDKPFR